MPAKSKDINLISQSPIITPCRKQFHQISSVFHEVIEDSSEASMSEALENNAADSASEDAKAVISSDQLLGEWQIPNEEITFLNKIVDGGSFGGSEGGRGGGGRHDIYNGRWHGDVVVHCFKVIRLRLRLDYTI